MTVTLIPDPSSQYLETLCNYLYNDVRPHILREPRLTVLCEVCTVLQALMVLNQPLDDEIEDDGEKDGELGQLHNSSTVADGIAGCTDETDFQGTSGDTVRDPILCVNGSGSRIPR